MKKVILAVLVSLFIGHVQSASKEALQHMLTEVYALNGVAIDLIRSTDDSEIKKKVRAYQKDLYYMIKEIKRLQQKVEK